MNIWKRAFVFGLFLVGFIGASFAATNPEWRPFKLDLGAFAPSGSAGPAASSKMEITVFGGYMSGYRPVTAKNVAADLLKGWSSPWYGEGYSAFSWLGTGVPAVLDSDMTASMLSKDSGGLAGIKLGFNIIKTFQVEVYFGYGFSGYSLDSKVWARFQDSQTKSISALQGYGRTVMFSDKSAPKAGKTILAGVNFNLGIGTNGPIMPYFSIGAGLMSVSDIPSIAWSLNQAAIGASNATYGLEITYAKKVAGLLSGALGFKYYIGPSYGLKLEVRGNVAMVSLDKAVTTTFQRSDAGWTEYIPYSNTALTEKGSPIFVTAIFGFFFGF